MRHSEASIENLSRTLELLKIEQEEDRRQYKEKVLQSPLSERKRSGITWYPILIKEHYYGAGERLILEIERPSASTTENQFQFGSIASLFSNYHNDGADNPSISGVVTSVRANNLKLTLFVDELPEWFNDGKLGLDLLFDETSYKEMEKALNKVMKARNNRLAQLREVILGDESPSLLNTKVLSNPHLNDSQNAALQLVSSAKDFAIIHGPPGTGKTTTLVQCIVQALKTEKQVLVCAPSNAAVDLITEVLAAKGVEVLRVGNPARVTEALITHTLDYKISFHPQFKQIKEFRKRALEFRNMGSRYKRNFGKEEREQRKMVFDEARKLQQEAEKIENFITEYSIGNAKVITATLVGSAAYVLKNREFSSLFIDEAGQALEPACWIPIAKSARVIMAGDHLQLPPTIKSSEAAKKGLSNTLMEKCMGREVSVMLKRQYRMNEVIMKFPSEHFYRGELIADEAVRNKCFYNEENQPLAVLEFIDTAGCSFNEQQEKESQSLYNKEEAELLIKKIRSFINEVSDKNFTVGIITPYKAQINLLRELIKESFPLAEGPKMTANTVDGFQGQERDVIAISLVRSNETGEIGFLSDTRRMNVAVTRAKKKLIVIGDSATLARHPFYDQFIKYAVSVNSYKSAWEYIYTE